MAADDAEAEAFALMRQQAEVRGDRDRLQALAGPLAAVWTGLKMDGPDIVVLLTDPAPHEEALLALLNHPDRVHVHRSAYTRTDLDEVHRQLLELIDDSSWTSHGPGLDQVHVTLRSGRAALAEQLHQRFGDALEITLGRHRFPLDPSRVFEPPPVPISTIDLPGLTCSVEPDQDVWAPGEDIEGWVHLTNDGPGTLTLSGGFDAVGVLLDGDGRAVGTWNGVLAGVLRVTTIAPGTQVAVRFLAGSDPRLGAALPSGTYLLVIPLRISDQTATGTRAGILVTEPVALQLKTRRTTTGPATTRPGHESFCRRR